MHLFQKLRRHGIAGSARIGINIFRGKARGAWRSFLLYRLRNEPIYKNPTAAELDQIEADLNALGERVFDYVVNPKDFLDFKQEGWFDPGYLGGIQSSVWDEKLLLISNKAPQALTSTPIGSTVVQKYYLESQGNAPEQNPVSGGVVPHPVHGAIRHRVTVRGSA
jgi:hypothetical protein